MQIVPNSNGEDNAPLQEIGWTDEARAASLAARRARAKAITAARRDPEIAAEADRIRKTGKTPIERRFAELIAIAEVTTNRALTRGTSKDQNSNPDGTYTLARSQRHAAILDKVGASAPAGYEQPIAVLMGGLTASGKTTAVGRDLNLKGKVVINADYFKEQLPGYSGKNAEFFHEESSDLAESAFYTAMGKRQHIVYDATMTSLGTGSNYDEAQTDGGMARKLKQLREAGYRVEIRFCDVDVETSVARAMRRYVDEELATGKGRYVPAGYIRSLTEATHGSKPRRTFEALKNHVDAYLLVDNRGRKPRLIARKGRLSR